jgi:hypothetical protein
MSIFLLSLRPKTKARLSALVEAERRHLETPTSSTGFAEWHRQSAVENEGRQLASVRIAF